MDKGDYRAGLRLPPLSGCLSSGSRRRVCLPRGPQPCVCFSSFRPQCSSPGAWPRLTVSCRRSSWPRWAQGKYLQLQPPGTAQATKAWGDHESPHGAEPGLQAGAGLGRGRPELLLSCQPWCCLCSFRRRLFINKPLTPQAQHTRLSLLGQFIIFLAFLFSFWSVWVNSL